MVLSLAEVEREEGVKEGKGEGKGGREREEGEKGGKGRERGWERE